MSIITPPTVEAEIYYPSSDGEPVAETQIHFWGLVLMAEALQDYLAEQPDVYIGANMFWYFEEGNPKACRAPDVMAIKGVGRAERDSFRTWEENGAVPCLIVELTSAKTWREDFEVKRRQYAEQGVREYFLFDPKEEILDPPLLGFRLNDERQYEPIEADLEGKLLCEEFGLYLQVEDRGIRLIEAATGERLLSRQEREQKAIRRAERAESEVIRERERSTKLEAENARLRALLDERKDVSK